MLKKRKENRKQFEEVEFPSEEKKKKPEIPIRIKEEDEYAVLEPFDTFDQKRPSTEQKPRISGEVIEIKKIKPKEEKVEKKETKPKEMVEEKKIEKRKEEVKPEQVKPKLIIRKIKPKEIKLERPVQKVLPKPPEITKPEAISKIPINHIETDIDKLMKIIDEKKIVGLEYLSKTLKISVDRLESWAKMLEDRGLIEIEYPIIGLPKLRKVECKKES